jgi:very-short-patch-repair endonuclease
MTLGAQSRDALSVTSDELPFTYRAGIDGGLSAGELRSARLNRSVYGVRTHRLDPDFETRCRMFAARMPPGAFFSHATAALLHGVPLPWNVESAPRLHIALAAPARAPHARGIVGHELEVDESDVIMTHGLRATGPARTWCDLGEVLRLKDLVAAGDYFINRNLPLATVHELHVAAADFLGRRGVRVVRQSLELLDDRSESRPESILRVIIVQGGLPTPLVNHQIVDSMSGRQVRPDFRFDEYKTVLEYQGDYHRTKIQWRKDMTRRSRLEADGWKVMELNWDDLQEPHELVRRIRTLLRR